MAIDRDLELLYEVGTMRFIARKWSQFGNPDFSNLAEHTLRVAWIAMVIGKYENANLEKIAMLAIVHDISETRTGDANYLNAIYTSRNEKKAVSDAAKNTILETEIVKCWNDVETPSTLEAKIVKDADSLDCDLELQEQLANGKTLKNTFLETRQIAFNSLYTETAKRFYLEIINSDPHSWHKNNANIFTNSQAQINN